jgi:CheY-like chemotaxis protein
MRNSEVVLSQLPYLRRYARALSGSQRIGDLAVKSVLEDVLADRVSPIGAEWDRVGLYRAFHERWPDIPNADGPAGESASLREHLAQVAPARRQAFLLEAMEEFAAGEIAMILDLDEPEARALIDEGAREVAGIAAERVLVIEDEMLIALDLKELLEELGHEVLPIARSRDEAVRIAKEQEPGLILSDINLEKGGSGIEAVTEILGAFAVPVIFVTAYPERLLTGDRIEPAFLVPKPFRPESIGAAVAQALICRRTASAS